MSNYLDNMASSELLNYIPRTTMDEVCESISRKTGIFTGIEDYRGTMLSFGAGKLSCRLCRQRRIRVVDTMTCQRIDAFASIEASRLGHPIIYLCPYGLIDMCAPIIIGGRLQGAVFMGQVLTDQKEMDTLQQFNIPINDKESDEIELQHQYNEEIANLERVPFSQIEIYLSLLDASAHYLSELGTHNMLEQEVARLNQTVGSLREENERLQGRYLATANQLSNHLAISSFTISSLNSVNQLAVIENAPDTKKGMQNLMQLLQYISDDCNVFTILERELAYASKYIELQKIINSRIVIRTNINVFHMEVTVPQMILIQLIDNAYQHAFTSESTAPLIQLNLQDESGYVVITVSDNGVGTPDNISTALLHYMYDSAAVPDDRGQLFLILRNLKYLYGNSFRFDIDSKVDAGTTITISLPNRRPAND